MDGAKEMGEVNLLKRRWSGRVTPETGGDFDVGGEGYRKNEGKVRNNKRYHKVWWRPYNTENKYK